MKVRVLNITLELRECFNDCFCLFTKSVGFYDTMLTNYKTLRNFWHTMNLRVDEQNVEKILKDDTSDCKIIVIINSNIC